VLPMDSSHVRASIDRSNARIARLFFTEGAIHLLLTSTLLREIAIKHMVAKRSTPIFRPAGMGGNRDTWPFDGILRMSFGAGPWLLRAGGAHGQQYSNRVLCWFW